MLRYLPALFLFATSAVNAGTEKCAIIGDTMHWAADYCMYAAATDDFSDPKVVECFDKQSQVRAAKTCSAKVKYKTDICTLVIRDGFHKGTVAACVRDKSFYGSTVRNGGL